MNSPDRPIRWGVIGTANIARHALLPAVANGGGIPVIVGSRDADRGRDWAVENGVQRSGTYRDVLDAEDIDAIYIALPNNQHVEWTRRAAETGRAVLCEKPLGTHPGEVASLVTELPTGARVWEAFAFPFHEQTERITTAIANGLIGELRSIESEFHFTVRSKHNIRWNHDLGGGALLDVGCYPIRLARLLFDAEPVSATARARWEPSGVDAGISATMAFPGGHTLELRASLDTVQSTATRIQGDVGELRVSNPFHPTADDALERWSGLQMVQRQQPVPQTSFEHLVAHIHAVLLGGEPPRHTVVADSLAQARAIEKVQMAMGTAP